MKLIRRFKRKYPGRSGSREANRIKAKSRLLTRAGSKIKLNPSYIRKHEVFAMVWKIPGTAFLGFSQGPDFRIQR